MKKNKQKNKAGDEMDMEVDDLTQIKEEMAALHKAQEPIFSDKIHQSIMTTNVFISEFQ